ncbi:hypothetical protein [Candidatus Methylomicrobium oryzae]|uniref:hypothetical protein n=1 Tax=Candidatus Methylomicrobium oryzae TaxID=2802053 RepID=UPI0019219A83|nr:hypothetical protein [Methylomicrobium sp. RS1]MBL1264142.1 hypothetical protein [Methylomicrobium sp. RS1]
MDMIVRRFVSGNRNRIFINPALGCQSSCSYCYLEHEGFTLGQQPSFRETAEKLIYAVYLKDFQPGKNGTVISIGCFSECWDKSNIEVSKKIISYFLSHGNPVQFATKRSVNPSQIKEILPQILWKGQLTLFVSCASITEWKTYEKGTTNPALRFKHIGNLVELGLMTYIYIKPVIEGVTIKDTNLFLKIALHQKCDVVVGSLFVYSENKVPDSPIPSTQLYIKESIDEINIINAFAGVSKVYRNSIDAVNIWRNC